MTCNGDILTCHALGDTHRGTRTSPSPDTWGFYFSGHRNFKAIISHIRDTIPAFRKAKHVLLTGGSAGGIGALYNADWLAENLTGVPVKSAPLGGWFFPGNTSDHPMQPQQPPSMYPDWIAQRKTEFNSSVSDLWQVWTKCGLSGATTISHSHHFFFRTELSREWRR